MERWAMLMCFYSDLISVILITWGVDHHMHIDFVVDMSVIPLTSLCFALTEPRQKTLDLETSCQMLELVLGQRPLVLSFIQFLEVLTLFIGSLWLFVCSINLLWWNKVIKVWIHLGLWYHQVMVLRVCNKLVAWVPAACEKHVHVITSTAHLPLVTLQEQSEYKAMNLDQWTAFLRLCDEVSLEFGFTSL